MGFIKFKFERDEDENDDKALFEIPISKGGGSTSEKKSSGKEAEAKKFILEWDKELGYTADPFEDKILEPVDDFFIGYDRERQRINLFVINNHKFGKIIGESGVGKTIALMWLYEVLKGHKNKIFVSFIDAKKLAKGFSLLDEPLSSLVGFYDKKIKKVKLDIDVDSNVKLLKSKVGQKKIVLLIDNFEYIIKDNLMLLDKLLEFDNIHVVVAEANDAQPVGIVKERDALNITLKGLSFDEAREMIKRRIERFGGKGIYPFEEKHLEKIYEDSKKNPRKILEISRERAIEASVRKIKKSFKKEEAEDDELQKNLSEIDKAAKRVKSEYKIEAIKKPADDVVIVDKKGKKKEPDYIIRSV